MRAIIPRPSVHTSTIVVVVIRHSFAEEVEQATSLLNRLMAQRRSHSLLLPTVRYLCIANSHAWLTHGLITISLFLSVYSASV
jgi:hypothetical protein